MLVIAHIGKIPVEEYAGFLVPVILLYAYGRAWSRRRRKKTSASRGRGCRRRAHVDQLVVTHDEMKWAR
jgi:hypothetical protein